MDKLPRALLPLTDAQYVVVKYVPREGGGTDKIPINSNTMQNCNALDPVNWLSAGVALIQANMLGQNYGIGFVFTADDPFWFIDIDHCIQDEKITQTAADIINLFPQAAIEISHSGSGLHLFGTGSCPDHTSRNADLGMEFYTENRFVAVTGMMLNSGSASTDYSTILGQFVTDYFTPSPNVHPAEWTTVPVPEWHGPEDDLLLIQKAVASKSIKAAFGGCSFADIWGANIEVLSKTYPDPTRDYDASAADAALAQHLAFWTGKHCDRIERLMRKSSLLRKKWDRQERFRYLERTILKAVARQANVYSDQELPSADKTDFQFLTGEGQKDHFKGCVYVRDAHKIWCPDGGFLKPDQFRAVYGGYVFQMDYSNSKTTRSAWEAFTESQIISFPKVALPCFRPELPSGCIVNDEGQSMVNVYVPINTTRFEGDITRFEEFLAKLLPDPNDREILVSYMAGLVQNPGVKFQWAPLLQGAQGNGKTFLIDCLEHAVGYRYSHRPNAADLAKNGQKFTLWLHAKLLISIEEIYCNERKEITEILKPMITNARIEIQGKGSDQYTGDNRANFILTTNHKDALKVSFDTRRYAIFYTAQQNSADLARDGMSGGYFPELYKWARSEGFAIINNYLQNYTIKDELNPATYCHRAPATSSTPEAVKLSVGNVEQEILEAIEEARPGFIGGWVSSMAVDRLLEDTRNSKLVPRNKRRAVLQSIGYDWHPALLRSNGRVNNIIPGEGGAPKLYIKNGHLLSNLTTSKAVTAAYMESQGYVTPAIDVPVNKS